MKKEDMTRLYSGGKAVLKPVSNILTTEIKILVFILLPFSGLFPQIPINGFCKYNSFVIDSGFTGIFTANFNKDSYTDIVLYNPHKKEILALEGNRSGTFSKNRPYRAPFEISRLQNITDKNNHITGFAYTSRKSMKAGICELLKDGRIRILKEIKFNSYPENISSADINRDGLPEIIVSGSAFDGISVIEQKNNKLHGRKIAGKTSYSNAVFIDLSNDGYPDIAAINVYSNSIDFFYNNSTGSFKKVRSLNSEDKITTLKTFDMNLDYYEDLVYSCGKKIIVQYGDASSSYGEKVIISTLYAADKIIAGDFNSDGYIDIVYCDTANDIVSVIFSRDGKTYYPEIPYYKKEGLEDILPYYSKFISGIISVSSSGYLYTVTKLSSFSGEVNITPAIQPAVIQNFDSGNDGITDICYLDNYDSHIKFIVRNSAGVPYMYYAYPVYASHSSIIADDTEPSKKIFYCYSEGKKLIEAISADFSTNKFSRQTLYSPGTIKDLKIGHKDENRRIYTAYLKNGKLGLSVFSYHNFRYTSSDYTDIASDISGVNISLSPRLSVYFWQAHGNKVKLSKYSADSRNTEKLVEAAIPGGEIKSLISFTGDLFNNEREVTIAFLGSTKNRYVIICSPDMTKILNTRNLDESFDIPDKKSLYFGETRFNNLKKLIVLNKQEKSAGKIDFINRGKNFIVSKIADINSAGSFFVKNMSYKKYHIAYINNNDNCLTFREL
jgi:hypothetical protein